MDDIDMAQEREQKETDAAIAAILKKPMAAGNPGECDFCGVYFSRLVGGACGGCRDKYKLD